MASLGRADRPVGTESNDRPDLGKYAEALRDFVLDCDTTMTIGIQGEWGSGKTSLMNMVRGRIVVRPHVFARRSDVV
jgi:ABC-type polysaccharide/polyol phosphate transport system ATPase subunit